MCLESATEVDTASNPTLVLVSDDRLSTDVLRHPGANQ